MDAAPRNIGKETARVDELLGLSELKAANM